MTYLVKNTKTNLVINGVFYSAGKPFELSEEVYKEYSELLEVIGTQEDSELLEVIVAEETPKKKAK